MRKMNYDQSHAWQTVAAKLSEAGREIQFQLIPDDGTPPWIPTEIATEPCAKCKGEASDMFDIDCPAYEGRGFIKVSHTPKVA